MHYYAKFAGYSARDKSSDSVPESAKKSLLIYAKYDLTFPLEYSLQVVKAFHDTGIAFEERVLPCGHYTTGETPFQYIDGWFMGSFVYRAFRDLAKEGAASASASEFEERELVLK